MGFIGVILSWILSERRLWCTGVWRGKKQSKYGNGTKAFVLENHYIYRWSMVLQKNTLLQ